MPRPITNSGLQSLLIRKGKEHYGEPFELADLASLTHTDRRLIHRYSTGRQKLPGVERRIANALRISIPELRSELGLPENQPTGGADAEKQTTNTHGGRRPASA